jgi:hypothetical protein
MQNENNQSCLTFMHADFFCIGSVLSTCMVVAAALGISLTQRHNVSQPAPELQVVQYEDDP